MVNSGSLSSEGDRNVTKASFIQANNTSSINPQSPSPITASGAIQARNNTSTTDGSYLPTEVRAIEPTPTKTDFGLGSTNLASFFGGKLNSLSKLREQDSGSGQHKTGLFCSLPLDRVKAILTTFQQNNKLLFTSGIIGKIDTAPTELASSGGIKAKSPRKILCLYCERTFANSNLRQKHVERCHSTKQFRRVSSRRNQSIPCVFNNCDKLTTTTEHTLKELFEHLVLNHSNKYYGCLSCEERFLNASHLDDHNASTHRVFPEIERESRRDEEVVVPTRVVEAQIETPSTPPQQKVTRSQLRTRTGNSSAIEIATMKSGRRRKKDTTTVQGYQPANSADKGLNKTKKLLVKSSRIVLKRSTRLQAKLLESQKKKRQQKKKKQQAIKKAGKSSHVAIGAKLTDKSAKNSGTSSASSSSVVNPYPEFDSLFRVKKITDHSIDNLKISSLTFDDVFDKAFFNRIKCNIQENLLHHIDGKLFENEESENRISNFEKISNTPQEVQQTTENYGCELTLNAVTPAPSALLTSSSAQFGEDLESQIEYGSKPSQTKKRAQQQTRSTGAGTGSEEAIVHYKYFTRRKYQASILEHKENRDLSKLDMWTQYVVKTRQQRILDEQKSAKELSDYRGGDEYVSRMRREELNRILDRRGPFEDLQEEASKKAVLDKLWGSERAPPGDYVVSEQDFSEVRQLIDDLLNRVVEICENVPQPSSSRTLSEHQPFVVLSPLSAADRYHDPAASEIPSYLNLRRTCTSTCDEEIDRSDKIALICSSQETENFELPTNKIRDKNEKVELTGEWARSRIFVCAACGLKFQNCKQLMEHKNVHHQNVWVQHYELVGNQSELYRHLSIPGLGKVGLLEDTVQCRQWKRSDARKCSKCEKQCNSLGELHRHILECGGDWTWMLARKKYKYRPFGAKSRRKRRGLVKRRIFTQKTQPTEKKIYKKTFDGPRPKPSDADTIQRMLANLPPKRATRKIMCLKDGLSRPRNKPQQQNQSPKVQNKMKCGKIIHRIVNEKTSTSEPSSSSPKVASSSSKNSKNNARNGYRKSLRNLNKVLASRILDTNSTLLLKRKLKRNATAPPTTPKHVEEAIEDVISENAVEQETDDKAKSPPKKKTPTKTVNKATEDDVSTSQSTDAEKEIAKSKRTSPRIDNKNKDSSGIPSAQSQPAVTKTVAEKMNIKRFFSVKKKNNSSQNVSSNEEGRKQTTKRKLLDSKRTAISLPENLEQIAVENESKSADKKCGKKRETFSNLVRTLSLRTKKRNTETVMMAKVSTNKPVEEVIANSKKRKLKNGIQKVVKQIKKIVSTEPQQTTSNNEQPADDKCLTSSSMDHKDIESVDNTSQPGDFLDKDPVSERSETVQEAASEPERIAIPAAAALSPDQSNGNVADPSIPTSMVVSCSTNENSTIPGTILDDQTRNEQISQPKNAMNVDNDTVAISLAAPSVSVSKEPESKTVQTVKTTTNPPAIQKGRMRTKKLNDCIAMLTDKLNKSLENIAAPNTSLNLVMETQNRPFDCDSTKTEDSESCGALNLVVDKNKNQSLDLSGTVETENRPESYILKVPLINNYFTQKKTDPKLDFPVDLQIRRTVDGVRKPENNRAFEQLVQCKFANNDRIINNPMQSRSFICDNKIAPFEKVVYDKPFGLQPAHSSSNVQSQANCYTERNLAFSEQVGLVGAIGTCPVSHDNERHANETTELNFDNHAQNQVEIVEAENLKSKKTTKPKRRSRSTKIVRKISLSGSTPECTPEQDQNVATVSMPTDKQNDQTVVSMAADIKQSGPAIFTIESDNQQNNEPLDISLATADEQKDASSITLKTSEVTTDISCQMQNSEKHTNESMTHDNEKHTKDSMDVCAENEFATAVVVNQKSKKASKPKRRSRSVKTKQDITLSDSTPEFVPAHEKNEAIISTPTGNEQTELANVSMESGNQQNDASVVASIETTDKPKDANTNSLETSKTMDLSCQMIDHGEKASNEGMENDSDVRAENQVATALADNKKPKKTRNPKGRSLSAKTIREIPSSDSIPQDLITSLPISSKQGEPAIVSLETTGTETGRNTVPLVTNETTDTSCQLSPSDEKHANDCTEVSLDKGATNPVATVPTDNRKSKKTSKPKRRSRSAKTVREIPLSDSVSEFVVEQGQNAAKISIPTISKQKSMAIVAMEIDNKQSQPALVSMESGNKQNDTPLIVPSQTTDRQMDENALFSETSCKQNPAVVDTQNVLETNIDDALKLIEIAVGSTATEILSQNNAAKKVNLVYSGMQEEPHILEKTYLIPNKSVENKEKQSDSEDEVPLSALVKSKEIENGNTVEDSAISETVKCTLTNKSDKSVEISDIGAKIDDSAIPQTNDEPNDNNKTDVDTCIANDGQHIEKDRANKKQKRRSRSRKKSLNGKIPHLTISDILENVSIASNLDESIQPETKQIVSEESSTIIGEPLDHNESVTTYDEINSGEQSENVTISANTTVEEVANRSQEISQIVPQEAVKKTSVLTIAKARRNRRKPSGFVTKRRKPKIQVSRKTIEQVAEVLLNETETTLPTSGNEQTADENQDVNAPKQDVRTGLEISSTPDKQETAERTSTPKLPELLDQNEVAEILHPVTKNGEIKGNDLTEDAIGVTAEESNVRRRSNRTAKSKALESILDDALAELTESERNREIFKSVLVSDNIVVKSTKKKKKSLERKKSNSKDRENSSSFDLIRENLCKVLLKEKRREVFNSVDEDEYDDLGTNDSTQGSSQIEENKEATSVPIAVDLPPSVRKAASLTSCDLVLPAPEADSTHANITSESRKESPQDGISSVDAVLTTENVGCADMEPITTPVEQNTTTFDCLDTAIPTDSGSVLPLAEPAALDCPVSSSNVPLIIETSATLQTENPVSESAPSKKELYCSVAPEVVDIEPSQPEVEQDPSEISNADTTELVNDAGKELRRSRRSSRKITSYNENELMNDPVLDDLPKPTARGQRERSSKKVATNGKEPESSKSSVGDLERTDNFTSSSTQKDTDWKTSDEVLSELVPNTEHTSVTTLVENNDVCEKFTRCNESTAVPELDVLENSNASANVLQDSVSGIDRTDLLTDPVLNEPGTNLTQDIPEESVFLSPVRKKARRAPRRSRNSRRGSKKRVPVTLEYSQKQSQKETQNSTPQATDQTKSEEHLKKLTSDELFDLLKTNSADDNNDVESTPVANNNAFLQNFDEISSDSRDDNFDILGESLVDDEDDVEENSSDKSFAPLEATDAEINSSFQNDRSVEETEPDPTNIDLSRESLDGTAQIDEFVEDDEVTTKMRPLKRTRSFNNRQKKTQEALLGEEIENQLADISSAVSNFDNTIADKAPDDAPEPVPSESSVEQVQPPVLLLSNKNNKKSNKREYKPGYCEICNKSFQRPDSLVKHKRTISHISKLSEIEAREAEQLKSQTADAEPSNDNNSRQQSMDAAEITSMDSSSKTLEQLTHDPVETTKTPEPLPPPLQPQNEDSRSSDVVEITSDASVNKNDINLFDMLQHSNRADANRSPFSLRMDNAGLKLAHIIVGTSLINDVLNKPTASSKDSILPVNPEPAHMFSQQQSPPEFRRYKSLGERKSFEAENPSPPHQIPAATASANENNMPAPVPQPAMDYFEPQLSQTAGTILEKQISLLQNIIENRSGVKYIDDISISSGGPSINNDNDDNCSDMSLEEDIPKSDDCCRIFTSTEQVLTNVNTLKSVAVVTVPLNEEDRGFLKPPPTQYEEISEDSSNLRNYDDQKSRKVLNRDEELFLECCSLLKSGSEVSSYSKKSQTLSKVLNNLDLKPSEEPSWLENKALPGHAKDYVSIEDYSDDDGSRIPTPLGDNFVDDQSNSNTISSNWDTSKLNNADDVIVVHDKEDENSRLAEPEVGAAAAADLTSFESRSFVFDKDRLRDDSEENLGGLDCAVKEDGIQENADEDDDDVFDDDPPEFGPQHFAEGGIIIRTKSVSEESSMSSHHEAEADATNRKKSEDLSDASTTDSRKMLTKGAMKVFEGLKVSIPTEDLNMAEVLNGSGIVKPNSTAVVVQEKRKSLTPEPVVATTAPTVSTAGSPKKLIKHKFSRGKLELGSKFLFKIKRKPTARAFRRKKQTGSNKMTSRTHDIYDFEETQDNSDVFTKPDFRSFRCSKKSNDAKKTEDSHNLVDSDNDSQDGAGGNNSTGFEAASSSASSVSDMPSKKPRAAQQTSTKKKCMIMGRIFKNAIKSRVEDEIRDIPVIDHTELVENFVMSCPDSLTDQNTVASKKPTVMTEEEMNSAFDKLVSSSDVVATEDINPCELMKKPATPTFTKPQNNHKTVLSSARKRTSKIKPRKRARADSDSTDDEFSLTSKKRNYRKNSKTEDNSINLEQELRECMGVASRKSQRKCTSGKQNVLVEYWSSDESNFEAMLESQILPQPANSAAKKHDNNGDLGAATPVTQAPALNNGETSTVDRANDRKQPEEQKLAEKEQPTTTTSQSSEDHVRKPAENRRRKPTKVRRLKSPTTSAVSIVEDSQPASNKKELATTTTATGDRSSSPATASPTSMLNRRKRAAPNPLYHWSSSSEDESCDLIEIKPIRDELEDDEDRPVQHGWIVGDSPKKLVTMLAQAKGKKCDGEGVKEQGGKKRNSSSGGGNHNAFS